MGFIFRLERVARYRQRLVDEQGRRLAVAERLVTGVQSRLAAVDADLRTAQSESRTPADGVVNVQSLMTRAMWVTHLKAFRTELKVELAAARLAADSEREALRLAWRDLEVFNTLRAKKRAEWQADMDRRERLALDEVGQIRADRARRSKVAS